MIKLENIKKENNFVNCDAYPEDCKTAVHLTLDITTHELKYSELPKGYEWCTKHMFHAKMELLDMVKKEEFVEKTIVMWC